MKELIRFTGYTLAAFAMFLVLFGIAKSDASPKILAYSAIFIVVVLPLFIAVWMVRREKKAPATNK